MSFAYFGFFNCHEITFLFLEQSGPKKCCECAFFVLCINKGKTISSPPTLPLLNFPTFPMFFISDNIIQQCYLKGNNTPIPSFFQLFHFCHCYINYLPDRLIVWFCFRFENQGYSCKMTTPGILTVQCIDRLENVVVRLELERL